MHDAVIVGGGLFGQIIAAGLRSQGRDVLVLDRGEKEAGSRPAACLMKPSWFSGLGKDVFEPSLQLLDQLYGVRDLQFQLWPTRALATVHWCDPKMILAPETRAENVVAVRPGQVETERGEIISARLVVVAAGVWVQELLAQYPQQAQKGAAYLWPDLPSGHNPNFISPWAPYRQLVGFDRGDGYWMGDGTAIKAANWTPDRETMTYQRCASAIGRIGFLDLETGFARKMVGMRPYAKGHKPCLLEEVQPGLWVASGGAKNGTLAAGWAAHRIMEATQ
jgi:glycine/D-amino acid oxidase-like deaminating enzyme